MKKISLFIVCAIALLLVSCQVAVREDSNNQTPTSVVEKMYENIQKGNYEAAAEYCKIPDSVKVDVYEKYQAKYPEYKGMDWKNIVINSMNKQKEGFELKKFEVISEEISNTDPNNATVKTIITIVKNGVESTAECSFPVKRESFQKENDTTFYQEWKIIG